MDRRTFLALAAASGLAAAAGPALAAPIPLVDLSRYLNALRTVESDFTQIADDGTIATGRITIQRPGRIRFDYNPPEATLVMAGGGQVAIFDAKSNRIEPEQYPLSRTPLNIILDSNVDLGRANMVVGHRQDGVKTIVTAQDPVHPEYGHIELVFTGDPVELRQWVVQDGSGSRTTVILGPLTTGRSYPPSTFSITGEVTRRRG